MSYTQVAWWAWMVLIAFSLERWTYITVWLNSASFMKLCKKLRFVLPAHEVLAHSLVCNKLIQLSSCLFVHFAIQNFSFPSDKPYTVFTAVQLLLIGQFLNWAVYGTIGKKGVYYGCRLGADVPWVEGCPFTCCPHPQYVGAMLSLLGLGMLTITPFHSANGMWLMMSSQWVFYVLTMYVEEKL